MLGAGRSLDLRLHPTFRRLASTASDERRPRNTRPKQSPGTFCACSTLQCLCAKRPSAWRRTPKRHVRVNERRRSEKSVGVLARVGFSGRRGDLREPYAAPRRRVVADSLQDDWRPGYRRRPDSGNLSQGVPIVFPVQDRKQLPSMDLPYPDQPLPRPSATRETLAGRALGSGDECPRERYHHAGGAWSRRPGSSTRDSGCRASGDEPAHAGDTLGGLPGAPGRPNVPGDCGDRRLSGRHGAFETQSGPATTSTDTSSLYAGPGRLYARF